MTYMFLLYGDESAAPPMPTDPEGFAKMMEPWNAYDKLLEEAGVMRGGNALHPTSSATTVTAAGGEPVVTDGPFAETREQLGGYYMVECENLDEALKWAAKCPGTQHGRVEVRPLMSLPSGDGA